MNLLRATSSAVASFSLSSSPSPFPSHSLPSSLPLSLPFSLPSSHPSSLSLSLPLSLPFSLPSSLPSSLPLSLPLSLPSSRHSSPDIQYVFNKTMTTITTALTNLRTSRNVSSKQLTLFIGNQNLKPFDPPNNLTIVSIISVIVAIGIIGFILFTISEKLYLKFKKEKIHIHSPINWIMNMYKGYTKNEILPIISPKKAKESPFIGPIPTPAVLPNCAKLDEVEKGQNIMFRFRGPVSARFESKKALNDDNTQITIVTIV